MDPDDDLDALLALGRGRPRGRGRGRRAREAEASGEAGGALVPVVGHEAAGEEPANDGLGPRWAATWRVCTDGLSNLAWKWSRTKLLNILRSNLDSSNAQLSRNFAGRLIRRASGPRRDRAGVGRLSLGPIFVHFLLCSMGLWFFGSTGREYGSRPGGPRGVRS